MDKFLSGSLKHDGFIIICSAVQLSNIINFIKTFSEVAQFTHWKCPSLPARHIKAVSLQLSNIPLIHWNLLNVHTISSVLHLHTGDSPAETSPKLLFSWFWTVNPQMAMSLQPSNSSSFLLVGTQEAVNSWWKLTAATALCYPVPPHLLAHTMWCP